MAKGVTVDLIVDPKGAIQGLGQVEDKSSKVAGVMGKLSSVAAAGLVALGTAAVAAVAGLTAATKSAGEYAENVELAASQTHLTTDAVQELQYASKVTGVDFETISGSLRKLTRSIGDVERGNKDTAAAFDALGVSTVDANGELRDSTAIYSDVIAALGQVSNPTERDIIAMQLLGKSATALNPLIDGTAGSLTDLAAQARDAGAVLSGDMLAKLSSVDDAFDTLGLGVDAAKNALGLTLMPILEELGTEGTGLLGDFTNAVLDANGDLSEAAPAIGAVFGDGIKFLLGQLPKFLEVGVSVVTSLVTGIAKQAPTLVKQAIPVLVGFVTGILAQLPMLLDAGLKVLIALVQGVAAALPVLIPAAVGAVIGLVGALIDNLPLLIDAGIQLLLGVTMGLIDALPQLIDEIPTLITGIITALVEAIPQLVSAGVQLFLALVTNLPAILTGIVKAIPAIITGIVNAFTNPKTLKAMGQAGLELIRGLWEGIKGAGDWLWKQISGFFGGQIDQIKALLGIASPSTVFAGFGKNLVQGLAGGISGARGLASSAVTDLSRQVTSGFQGSLAANARVSFASSAAAGGGGGGLVVNVPATNSFIGSPDQLARELKSVIVDAIRTGVITADWNRK